MKFFCAEHAEKYSRDIYAKDKESTLQVAFYQGNMKCEESGCHKYASMVVRYKMVGVDM